MKTSLFMVDPGVPTGPMLLDAEMVDVAPTLAELMGLDLPTTEGSDLLAAETGG